MFSIKPKKHRLKILLLDTTNTGKSPGVFFFLKKHVISFVENTAKGRLFMAKNYIEEYVSLLEKEIQLRQKEIRKIEDATEICSKFLLQHSDNDVSEKTDILTETVATIEKLNKEINQNSLDISNIKTSLSSLKNIKNSIDETVILSLEAKIKEISEKSSSIKTSIETAKPSLDYLRGLPVCCPECGGKKQGCTVCKGTGVISITAMDFYSKNKKKPEKTEEGFSTFCVSRE